MDIVPSGRPRGTVALAAPARADAGAVVRARVSGSTEGRAELDVLVHAGAGGCAATAGAEHARVDAHRDAQDEVPVSMLLDRPGRFAQELATTARAAGALSLCAYLVPAGGDPRAAPLARAEARMEVGAAQPAGGGTAQAAALPQLRAGELAVVEGSGIACYAFREVRGTGGDRLAGGGVACLPYRPGASLSVDLGAAGLTGGGDRSVLVSSVDYLAEGLAVAGPSRSPVRRFAAHHGPLFVLAGSSVVCSYGHAASLDGSRDGVVCAYTSRGSLPPAQADVTAVVESSARPQLLRDPRLVGTAVVLGASGFFVDGRLAGALVVHAPRSFGLLARTDVCAALRRSGEPCP